MVLNYIWLAFFFIAFFVALIKLMLWGDHQIFPAIMDSAFTMAKTGFEIALFLTGAMALWLGLMRIGEKAGIVRYLYKLVGPFFSKLFPEIPKNHPVYTPMLMNFSANMLGLDNAATPLGLKAMEELQELNPRKDTASNAQIMFLVLNTSGLTLLPISIMIYRMEAGAKDPADVFIPILLSTFVSTLAGLIATAASQKINLFQKTILAYLGSVLLFIAGISWFFSQLAPSEIALISSSASNFILFSVIIGFLAIGVRKKINVYEEFVEGAKEAFNISITIVPYLIAMLVAIGVFRASGALDWIIEGVKTFFAAVNLDTDFVEALPTALMKPLSGSGARGMMVDAMETYGPDSFIARVSGVMQGSTETTLYVVALYFGAVKIRRTRNAITLGLFADSAGILAAIGFSYLFFAH
ncbi:MAG: spore maturation protein [Cytophagales bacterium]|nr:spore maturation protein [Cytophagales bacterium]